MLSGHTLYRTAIIASLILLIPFQPTALHAADAQYESDVVGCLAIEIRRGIQQSIQVYDVGHSFGTAFRNRMVESFRLSSAVESIDLPDPERRPFIYRILNITSDIGMVWVALGFLGQLLFTGRMLVQWLASEKARASVIPVMFWWMSLCGATMLLIYFIWRKDIVGILGQSTGWFIYFRNLQLIYRGSRGGERV